MQTQGGSSKATERGAARQSNLQSNCYVVLCHLMLPTC